MGGDACGDGSDSCWGFGTWMRGLRGLVCCGHRFLSNQMDPFLKGKWHSSKKSVQEEAETVKDIDREQRLFKNTKPKSNSLAFQHQSSPEVFNLFCSAWLVASWNQTDHAKVWIAQQAFSC